MQNNNNNNWISELVKKYNIVDVVQHYLQITKKGNDYKAICPFHADSNPSLSISPSKNVFKCFTCNIAGNALQFIMLYKKVPFGEAIKEFKTILNINDSNLDRYINSVSKINEEEQEIFNVNKIASFFYNNTLYEKENIKCLEYLKNRHIDDELIKFYEIGFAPKIPRTYLLDLFESTKKNHNIDKYQLLKSGLASLTEKDEFIDFFHDRLLIPIKNEHGYIAGFSGRTINPNEKIKYINTKTTAVFQKENILFNLFAFDKTKYDEIFVVEGYMDVFAFKRLGIENVVASMGTAFTQNQINIIKKYKNIKRVILCLDNDNAGNEATISLFEKLVKNNFDVFLVKPYDKKFKDIDELSRSLSKEECLKIINNQVGFIEYQIEKFKELDLSYKDKKIKLSNIIEMLNDFAYDYKFFTEDKKMISNFFDIDVSEVESLVKEKRNNYFNEKTNNSDNYNKSSNFSRDSFVSMKSFIEKEIKEHEFNKINFHNNGNLNILENQAKEQLKQQEVNLILNIIFSKQLAAMYFEYLGFILFNSNQEQMLYRVLKIIIDTVKKHINDNDYSWKLICSSIMNSDKLEDNQKAFFKSIIVKHLKLNDMPEINNSDSFLQKPTMTLEQIMSSQGIELLKKIKIYHFSQIILEKQMELNKYRLSNDSESIKRIEKETKIIEKTKNDFLEEINKIRLSI